MQKKMFLIIGLCLSSFMVNAQQHGLRFASLATRWDEAIPLGNGMLGTLIWEKNGRMRLSLDRADLWDLRPMKGLHREEFTYQWVVNQVRKKDYGIVQRYFDDPYNQEAGPSKIPGAALEFDIAKLGKIQGIELAIGNAQCEIKWENGTRFCSFVHAVRPEGWFRFDNMPEDLAVALVPPVYQNQGDVLEKVNYTNLLSLLDYPQGVVEQKGNSITYKQDGWNGFSYTVSMTWKRTNINTIEGVWSISTSNPALKANSMDASYVAANALKVGYSHSFQSHSHWWKIFWSNSSVHIPDTLIEKQWYLEQYKFGSTARRGAPPISLQAIWTADDGHLPPWKGDYHHDLNTELSYWPCYSGNHLEEGMGFIDHLEQNKPNYKRYTRMFFNVPGLATPGVTTLDGTEMGGWIQYALSPTTSAWLGHHYYLQWRYSMDKTFLRSKAYPWISDVARFFEAITVKDDNGYRQLPISSSPEINDNDISAWFTRNTNYDLALMKFTFKAAQELANELGLKNEATHWGQLLSQFDDFAFSNSNELAFAHTLPYKESHRHFSHLVGIHPLGLIRWEDGIHEQNIIQKSIHLVDSIGPAAWNGYSYAWLANLKARAKDGDGAASALAIFARAFCSKNSFHVNGDQTGSGYSNFSDRPFTLEGNFAFASGLQEMLLQSYAGYIEIMPAIPECWMDVSFNTLRAEGAFLVSAKRESGQITEIEIVAEKGGKTKLKLPTSQWSFKTSKAKVKELANGFFALDCQIGGVVVIKNK